MAKDDSQSPFAVDAKSTTDLSSSSPIGTSSSPPTINITVAAPEPQASLPRDANGSLQPAAAAAGAQAASPFAVTDASTLSDAVSKGVTDAGSKSSAEGQSPFSGDAETFATAVGREVGRKCLAKYRIGCCAAKSAIARSVDRRRSAGAGCVCRCRRTAAERDVARRRCGNATSRSPDSGPSSQPGLYLIFSGCIGGHCHSFGADDVRGRALVGFGCGRRACRCRSGRCGHFSIRSR